MSHQPAAFTLVLQNGPQPGQVFTLHQRAQVIGRGQGSTLLIPDKTLSRQHARVWLASEGVMVEDLGSTNGTFVNEQPVVGATRMRPGDTLRLGEVITFTVQSSQMALDELDTITPGRPITPPAAYRQVAAPGPSLTPPTRSGGGLWLGVGLVLAVVILLAVGLLAYLYYVNLPTLPAGAIVTAEPTATPLMPSPTNTATSTPSLEPKTKEVEALPIQVPGIPAAAAREQALPADFVNKIDPFCNKIVEITANEPVLVTWSRRLAQADDQTDYLAQWLAATAYDLTLNGQPVTPLNYERSERGQGPTLTWWVNLGLLPAGQHNLRLRWYTTRQLTSGLDLEPADGQADTFGPGLGGEGACQLVAPETIVVATSTPTPPFTPTPASTPTSPPTPEQSQVSAAPAPLGIFVDFEAPLTWKRGDQPYGDLTRSSAQVHSGGYAGQLSYNFPTNGNDYVVFLHTQPLAEQPNAISAWVYGDGAGHFLNLWLKDADGETWAMSFGRVSHTGWKEMTAPIDPAQPWPSGHISGPDNRVIDYPISFLGLVLDDREDSYTGSGVIYLDDFTSRQGVLPAPTPTTVPPAPGGGGQNPPAGSLYVLRLGGQHRYEEPWGAPKNNDPCDSWRHHNWDDKHADYRGFNVELLLTNNSNIKVQDDWGESMSFFTATGQQVTACYYSYGGAGPAPGGTTSVTFFSVLARGDYVNVMRLNLNGQSIQLCLDGRGGWSYCY